MGKELDIAYINYWRRKELIDKHCPQFKTIRYWRSSEMNPAEKLVFDVVKSRRRILDFGAGDLRIKDKLHQAGFQGEYKTLDHSDEYQHDYATIDEVKGHGLTEASVPEADQDKPCLTDLS